MNPKVGQLLKNWDSARYEPGDTYKTWDGYTVKVLSRRDNPAFGSWRYIYELEVIAEKPERERRAGK